MTLVEITAETGRTTIDLVVWSLAAPRAEPVVPIAVDRLREQWPLTAAFSVLPSIAPSLRARRAPPSR